MNPKRKKESSLFEAYKASKKHGRYTVMIIPQEVGKETRQYRVKAKTVWSILVTMALVLVLLVGFGVYGLRNLAEESAILITTQKEIAQVKKDNEELIQVNQELTNKVAILSDTVNQKVEEEAAVEAQEAEKTLPKGFPLSGTATVTEANANEAAGEGAIVIPMVIFEAAAGANVIAAGSGVVSYVGPDDTDYGNMIKIDHGNGYTSIYRNAAEPKVELNDEVTRGTLLFEMNENTTKLGYEIIKDGQFVEPLTLLEIAG